MADQGKNEAAKSLFDLQPTAILELFKIHPDFQNRPEIFFTFHGGSNFSNNITWQGIEYLPLPVETEGFGVFGNGTLPRPKIRVGNDDKIITLFLEKFNDFKNAVIFRKKVFLKHLDDVNFDGGNPFGVANPDAEISEEKYFFGQKTLENRNYVEFELNSPLDLDNFQVNERTVSAKYCYWQYRGRGCRYGGKPVEKSDGSAFKDVNGAVVQPVLNDEFDSETLIYSSNDAYTIGQVVYIENQKIIMGRGISQSPLFHKTYFVCVQAHDRSNPQHPDDNDSFWQKDGCAKKISACQKRFASDGSSLKRVYLGDGSDKTFKYIHNKPNNPLSFFTENDKITGDDSPLSYRYNDNLTVLCRFRKLDQSVYENSSEELVDETLFATEKLTRNTTTNETENTRAIRDGFDGFQVSSRVDSDGINTFDQRLQFIGVDADNYDYLDISTCKRVTTEGTFENYIFRSDSLNSLKFESISNQYLGINGELKGVHQRDNITPKTFKKNQPIAGSPAEPWRSSAASFLSLFGDSKTPVTDQPSDKVVSSFQGDIAQLCIWNRRLTDQELIFLGENNVASQSQKTITDNNTLVSKFNKKMPVSYSECTGNLESLTGDGLVVWYDMETGFLDSPTNTVTGILDQHTGAIHLSGYGGGEWEQRSITYTPANLSTVVANQDYKFTLPFGGFPGTDGYDYESRGTS